MPQYIVLQPISPEHGPLILPAQPSRDDPDAIPTPVIVDESVVSAEAAPILIERGVIAMLHPRPTIKAKAARADDDLKF